jgi:hypothetical protein
MDLREIGLGGVDWIRLAQDRDRWRAVVSAVMNLRVLAPRNWLVSLFPYLFKYRLLSSILFYAPLPYLQYSFEFKRIILYQIGFCLLINTTFMQV